LRIGVNASNSRRAGGQRQFLVTFLDALFEGATRHEFFLFYFADEDKLAERYAKNGWHWIRLPRRPGSRLGPKAGPLVFSWLEAIANGLGLQISPMYRVSAEPADAARHPIARFLAPFRLDLMLYPQWTDECWRWGVPYVFVVHDLQHRLQPEFAEVSMLGRWAQREQFFSQGIRNARLVVADSEEGRRNVVDFYGVDAQTVGVLPYTVPPMRLERSAPDLRTLGLPQRFFLYPAQFWPHKNHYRIVEALGILKDRYGLRVDVVFVGGEPAEWSTVRIWRSLAQACGVSQQIRHLGYVPDGTLAALYRAAAGLVMPTYFGPTNIPYLEAFSFRCPVIASDLPGIREQVHAAALLVDPKSSHEIARAMKELWSDEALRAKLIAAGEKRLQELGAGTFRRELLSLLDSVTA
jgi:glycosyltransferase involved in cell wall biosynthesis